MAVFLFQRGLGRNAVNAVAATLAIGTAAVGIGFLIDKDTPTGRVPGDLAFEIRTSSGAAGHESGTSLFWVDVLGNTAQSGALTIQNLKSCSQALETTSTGMVICGTDAGGSSITYAEAQSYFVDDSGDNMTGSLVLDNGSELHSSGSLFTRGDLILNSESGAVNVGITFGASTPERLRWLTAESRFEFSDDLNVTDGITASGTLVLGGAARFKSTITSVGNIVSAATISGSILSGNTLRIYQITPRHVSAQLVASGTALATGSGTVTFIVPPDLNGFNLVDVLYCVDNVGVTGTAKFQIYNRTDSTFMLSTPASIDTVERCTTTAAAAPVVNGSADDVATNDLLQFGTPAIHTTAAKGLFVRLTFAKP